MKSSTNSLSGLKYDEFKIAFTLLPQMYSMFPISLVFKNVFLFFILMLLPVYRISFPGNMDIFHLSTLFQHFKASIEYILIFHRVLQDPFSLI